MSAPSKLRTLQPSLKPQAPITLDYVGYLYETQAIYGVPEYFFSQTFRSGKNDHLIGGVVSVVGNMSSIVSKAGDIIYKIADIKVSSIEDNEIEVVYGLFRSTVRLLNPNDTAIGPCDLN